MKKKKKIAEVQGQLKQEMKKIRGNHDGQSSHVSSLCLYKKTK